MSRYIDADKANDFIKRSDAIDTMRRFNGYFDEDTITRFEIALTNYIQAADVVEVVRCKDCKHNYRRTTWNHGERDNPSCKYTNYVRDNDFYCGYGERAEE